MIELNKCYCMDNLELMKQIDDNSIDLIYGDILYGTGRKFDDYQDLKANKNVIEEFYVPRIQEMYRILKPTGSIYLQMDWHINHWIRCIMENIFGYKNFRNEIIWSYKSGGASKNYFPRKHDNILFFTKTDDYTFNKLQDKNYMKHNYGFSNLEKYQDEDGSWYYLGSMRDTWEIPMIGKIKGKDDSERVGYDTQKPKELLERVVRASSNEGYIVFDGFCGSGTTGVVAKELNRKYILCDISERAIEISEERLKQ